MNNKTIQCSKVNVKIKLEIHWLQTGIEIRDLYKISQFYLITCVRHKKMCVVLNFAIKQFLVIQNV